MDIYFILWAIIQSTFIILCSGCPALAIGSSCSSFLFFVFVFVFVFHKPPSLMGWQLEHECLVSTSLCSSTTRCSRFILDISYLSLKSRYLFPLYQSNNNKLSSEGKYLQTWLIWRLNNIKDLKLRRALWDFQALRPLLSPLSLRQDSSFPDFPEFQRVDSNSC